MTPLVAAHLALVASYAGVQVTVWALVYPQFAAVPPAAFAEFHRGHSRRIARVVGPLFAGQLGTTGWLLLDRPDGVPLGALLAGAGCLGMVLALTALGAVPQHRRLAAGRDAAAYRRLLRVDAARTAATVGTLLSALWLALA